MRSEEELLEVMLEHQELFADGLCLWSHSLYINNLITIDEHILLKGYIRNNRPSKFSSPPTFRNSYGLYSWNVGEITTRIKWIKKHINNLK